MWDNKSSFLILLKTEENLFSFSVPRYVIEIIDWKIFHKFLLSSSALSYEFMSFLLPRAITERSF